MPTTSPPASGSSPLASAGLQLPAPVWIRRGGSLTLSFPHPPQIATIERVEASVLDLQGHPLYAGVDYDLWTAPTAEGLTIQISTRHAMLLLGLVTVGRPRL